MIRKLLGVVVLVAMPALLTAQTPATPHSVQAKEVLTHGIATQVQGDVVATGETGGQDTQAGRDEANGPDTQEGVDEPNGPNNQEGVDQTGGPNDQVGDQAAPDQGSEPAPPKGVTQNSRIGSHRP